MADFDNELDGYLKAKTASDAQEKTHAEAEANAKLFHHPEGFHPTPDAPAFAQHPLSQMWHDATTGTFSFYDPNSETYIPVQGPDSPNPLYHTPTHYDTDPVTGYQIETYPSSRSNPFETPPESDATMRLCVLSSNILKVGGVILMDASGISFGRDRPLSGQGKRVRMVEMEISRFHAVIFLDRKEVRYGEPVPEQDSATEAPPLILPAEEQGVTSHLMEPREESTIDSAQESAKMSDNIIGSDEDGAIEETEQAHEYALMKDTGKEVSEVQDGQEDGEISDSSANGDQETADITKAGEQRQEEEAHLLYKDYQLQVEQYQQYYQNQPPTFIDTFQITDCGSTHGTLLNGQRISPPKTASQPFPLHHLDQLQMGSTIFEIHEHGVGRICASCQVKDENEIEVLDDKEREGTKDKNTDSPKSTPALTGDSKLTREQERIEEMNRLKKKWAGPEKKPGKRMGKNQLGIFHGSGANAVQGHQAASSITGQDQQEYVDRAAKRRMYYPDNTPPVPSVTPVYATEQVVTGFHVPVASTNKGHAMLSKMGWKAGTGLGASGQGLVEPVQLVVSDKKAGLGSATLQHQGAAAMVAARVPETQGEAARRRARERFAQLNRS